jgi:hypothetical protein
MRVNVYGEELTTESLFVTKKVDGKQFYGIRLFLKSATELHNDTAIDDDRSAITLWIPRKDGRNQMEIMWEVLYKLSVSLQAADRSNIEYMKSKIEGQKTS